MAFLSVSLRHCVAWLIWRSAACLFQSRFCQPVSGSVADFDGELHVLHWPYLLINPTLQLLHGVSVRPKRARCVFADGSTPRAFFSCCSQLGICGGLAVLSERPYGLFVWDARTTLIDIQWWFARMRLTYRKACSMQFIGLRWGRAVGVALSFSSPCCCTLASLLLG